MSWSSVHRGDFDRLRRNLTVALLEAESMEPRIQVLFSQDSLPAEVAANVGLLRLLLERADKLSRGIHNSLFDYHYHVNDTPAFADKALVGNTPAA